MLQFKNENEKEFVRQIVEAFEGEKRDEAKAVISELEDHCPMTGSALCGKTADDVLRQVLDDTLHNGLMNG